MNGQRRLLTYVVIALIVGAALALAVALSTSSGHGTATAAGDDGTAAASHQVYSDGTSATVAQADPAREQPLLDKFTSKDPFMPFYVPAANPSGSASPNPNPTSTSTPNPSPTSPSNLSAKVKVDGTNYNVSQGDKVPGGSAAEFTVTGVSTGSVTFKVITGTLKNGDKTFSVDLGESVRVTLDAGVSYNISVLSIGKGGGGTGGHSISCLSVTVRNGTAYATFQVDGTVYADKVVGQVFTTSWGQIEVVAINVSAQTVTILHGDQRLTLYAGQVIVK